jgi:NAD(P)H-nitrite reductase large subunit
MLKHAGMGAAETRSDGQDGARNSLRFAMPQAIVDPEELRRFAQNLKKFNIQMQEQITVLGTQLKTLGKTWRDQEHRKFAEEFEAHIRVISRFIEITEEHVPYLLRKAQIIEQYLQQP